MILATAILLILAAYFSIGLIFGLWFIIAGLPRFDHSASDSPWSFRLLILPGSMALWPLLALHIRSRRKETN